MFKTDWAPTPIEVRTSDAAITLESEDASLSLSLEDGSWSFADATGAALLQSAPNGAKFNGPEIGTSVLLDPGDAIFGLGETTGPMNKRGLVREFWNTDVLGHAPAIHPSLRSLYVSIPFALLWREGRVMGLFWDNPARQTWDLGQTDRDLWQMKAASGELDLYLFSGQTVGEIVERFTELTGRMPMPPRWALGYQQCRYSYETAERVREVARNFRERAIPCDVLYLDIHHMDGYRVFTFGKTYPKPAQLIAELGAEGFQVVTIVDPGVKDDPKFGVLKRGVKQKAFVKTADGKQDYVGEVWPGASRFPDFLNPRVRRWWGREQAALTRKGVSGFWNDMNEPANFALPSKTLPPDSVHQTASGPRTHAEVHNLYGLHMAQASREGALAAAPDRRPFIITRAGYAGIQRHAMVWTGDNSSVWEHLADSIQQFLNLSLSGVAFVGGDVGGFLDNTTPELFIRWLQFAVFTPFLRNHSNIGTLDQEPWALGESVEALSRRYIELRYRLLPYLYCLFHEAHRDGTPILRPMWWNHQGDAVAVGCDDQFLLGHSLLVAPVIRQGAQARAVYLPEGVWFDFWTGARHKGGRHIIATAPLDTIPLFVQAGGILPLGPVLQHVDQKTATPVELHVWVGANNELVWVEDDGHSLDYERGGRSTRLIEVLGTTRKGCLRIEEPDGDFRSKVESWTLTLHGLNSSQDVWINNAKSRIAPDPVTQSRRYPLSVGAKELEVRWG